MALTIIGNSTPTTGNPNSLVAVQQVRAYWEALRPPGGLPHRDQIDPRGLSDALGQVFLIERIAPGHARFRIAGSQLHDLLAMDLRGMPLSALFEPSARPRLSEAMETSFIRHAVVDLWLQAERGLARAPLAARMVLLPLIGTQAEPDLLLGCLALDGEVGRAPRRFVISGYVSEPIGAVLAPLQGHVPAKALPKPTISGSATPMLRLVSSRD